MTYYDKLVPPKAQFETLPNETPQGAAGYDNPRENIDPKVKEAVVHANSSTQAHIDYLLNSGTDIAAGPLTITADNSTADQAYVPMVLYNTDAVPPAANTVPIGTIYIQYTA